MAGRRKWGGRLRWHTGGTAVRRRAEGVSGASYSGLPAGPRKATRDIDAEVESLNPVIVQTEDQIEALRRACAWLGVRRGRASRYQRLLEESLDGACEEEHLLAAFESSEIVDLYVLWERHAAEFPGVKDRLRRVAAKGATLREGERPASSGNRPRNDAFVLLLAGKLLAADIDIVGVDGIMRSGVNCRESADIVLCVKSEPFAVECKRLQSWNRLEERFREASRQFRRRSLPGMVAVDCSVLLRPPGTLLESRNLALAGVRVSELLEHRVAPRLYRHFTPDEPDLLGTVLFARIPAMTQLDLGVGRFRRDRTSSWLMMKNRYAEEENSMAMDEIGRKWGNAAQQSGVQQL